MRAFLVVADDPPVNDFADLIEGREEPAVKDLIAIGSIKAFDESVLIRFAGLDVPQFDALCRAPIGKVLCGRLGAVVQAKRLRPSSFVVGDSGAGHSTPATSVCGSMDGPSAANAHDASKSPSDRGGRRSR
jgi:hypothetical protein